MWLDICNLEARNMSRFLKIAVLLAALIPLTADAQGGYDVFNPIAKYFAQGDVESLSSWFADNLEVTIGTRTNVTSSSQAKQIVKTFFESNSPRSFDINHKASDNNTKYAIGSLNAGGTTYMVTIFVSLDKDRYKIQQLKIDSDR